MFKVEWNKKKKAEVSGSWAKKLLPCIISIHQLLRQYSSVKGNFEVSDRSARLMGTVHSPWESSWKGNVDTLASYPRPWNKDGPFYQLKWTHLGLVSWARTGVPPTFLLAASPVPQACIPKAGPAQLKDFGSDPTPFLRSAPGLFSLSVGWNAFSL